MLQTYERKLSQYREHVEESQPSVDASLSKVRKNQFTLVWPKNRDPSASLFAFRDTILLPARNHQKMFEKSGGKTT